MNERIDGEAGGKAAESNKNGACGCGEAACQVEGDAGVRETLAITKVLHNRFSQDGCLCPGERESVAYRMAEIVTCAKDIYTQVLPRLLQEKENEESKDREHQHGGDCDCGCGCGSKASDGELTLEEIMADDEPVVKLTLLEELAGARMAFMHMKDLVEDFDEAFMDAMTAQRQFEGIEDEMPENECVHGCECEGEK